MEVACLGDAGDTARELVSIGVPVFALRVNGRYDIRSVVRLGRLIHRRGYDVVHVHLLRAGIQVQPLSHLLRVPVVVYTEHSIGRQEIEGIQVTPMLRELYRLSTSFSDRIVAVSPWVQDRLLEWGIQAERIALIENGVDFGRMRYDADARGRVRAEFAIPDDATVLGSVCRMVPRKKVDLLIQAAAPRVRQGDWLVLVGDGDSRSGLESLAARLMRSASERVIFAGTRRNVRELLSAFDVFASLVSEEMYGLAPVEALAAGLPVVVTHSPPLEGIGTPWVRRTTPDLDDVRNALDAAVAQPPDRLRANELYRQRFDVEITVQKLDLLYEQALRLSGSGNASGSVS